MLQGVDLEKQAHYTYFPGFFPRTYAFKTTMIRKESKSYPYGRIVVWSYSSSLGEVRFRKCISQVQDTTPGKAADVWLKQGLSSLHQLGLVEAR